ncbi:MAG: methionine synthase [Arthrospira sp. SH-MAG29]|nr:Npun_R2821/Npun_R2822 family protein [Arthrospira sp. SH-MAG29]MBS0015718.1 methionine synthase [Arthrospira sp. SH-MAG29]
MTRGIYIVANDRVQENAIALLNSIRRHNQSVPVVMIPFNEEYHQVFNTLNRLHEVQLFPNLEFLEELTQKVGSIFDRDFLKLPNKMRKLAVWFGPLQDFLYIDTDIIVFEDIAANLDYLSEVDFFCCDYHHAGEKLRNIFSPVVLERNIFTETDLEDVFNSGFWASKKGAITLDELYQTLQECSQHREYFDFTQGVTDQPIFNYLVLKHIPKRGNLVKRPGGDVGSWAGSKHFQERNHILYDKEKPLKYLHWAGTPLKPGQNYWDIWEYYRYLHEGKPAWQRKLSRLFSFVKP